MEMHIVITSFMGSRYKLTVKSNEPVINAKKRLWCAEGVPISQQQFVYKDQTLHDSLTWENYGVFPGASIQLIVIARSGPLGDKTSLQRMDVRGFPECGGNDDEDMSGLVAQCSTRNDPPQLLAPMPGECSTAAPDEDAFVDMTFDETRRLAALRRADENLLTMRRMQKLRLAFNRLQLKKGNGDVNCSPGPSTLGNAHKTTTFDQTECGRSERCLTVDNSVSHLMVSPASNQEDTSAKESSAGETEIDDYDCTMQKLPVCFGRTRGHRPRACSTHHHGKQWNTAKADDDQMPSCVQYISVSSSCSEAEQESSAACSSEFDSWLSEKNDEAGYSARSVKKPKDQSTDEGDEEDEEPIFITAGSSESIPFIFEMCRGSSSEMACLRTSVSVSDYGFEDTTSDPSEFSSGMVISHWRTTRRSRGKRRCHLKGMSSAARRFLPPECEVPVGVRVSMGRTQMSGLNKVIAQHAPCRRCHFGHRIVPAHLSRHAVKAKHRLLLRSRVNGYDTSSDEQELPCRQKILSRFGSSHDRIRTYQKEIDYNTNSMSARYSSSSHGVCGVGSQCVAASSFGGSSSAAAAVRFRKPPQSSQSQQRCQVCGCRLSIATTFQCRCGKTLCLKHKSAIIHRCFEYRSVAAAGGGTTSSSAGPRSCRFHAGQGAAHASTSDSELLSSFVL